MPGDAWHAQQRNVVRLTGKGVGDGPHSRCVPRRGFLFVSRGSLFGGSELDGNARQRCHHFQQQPIDCRGSGDGTRVNGGTEDASASSSRHSNNGDLTCLVAWFLA